MPNPVQQPVATAAYQEFIAQQMKQLQMQPEVHLTNPEMMNYQAMLFQQDPNLLQFMWLQQQNLQQQHQVCGIAKNANFILSPFWLQNVHFFPLYLDIYCFLYYLDLDC